MGYYRSDKPLRCRVCGLTTKDKKLFWKHFKSNGVCPQGQDDPYLEEVKVKWRR